MSPGENLQQLQSATGAEAQRPLATRVIGGVLPSTALTPPVLPLLYRCAHGSDEDELVEPRPLQA